MGLTKYVNVRAGALSGGNKRKLSVAVACIGNPPVVFLDEPSAGMDPGARKQMWKVINDIKNKKCSIILTTHSMDEAEALCDRIAIMVGGRFKCLGTATHIKNKFGSGYEFLLKVRQPRQDEIQHNLDMLTNRLNISQSIPDSRVDECLQLLNCMELKHEIKKGGFGAPIYQELQTDKAVSAHTFVEWCITEGFGQRIYDWLRQHFKQVVIIEHYLTFYKFKVEKEQGQSLGYLFGVIEDNREALNISEYSLSQTSLEQIFNMFATQTEDLLQSSKRMRQSSVRAEELE
jgi:ATP-binding cassette subfamily A (ABC1) protein 3